MDEKPVVTSVLLDERTLDLLRDLARLRARLLGGRPSGSAVLRQLVRDEAAKKLPQGGDAA